VLIELMQDTLVTYAFSYDSVRYEIAHRNAKNATLISSETLQTSVHRIVIQSTFSAVQEDKHQEAVIQGVAVRCCSQA